MGFELDEWIFGKVARYFKLKKRASGDTPETVSLIDIKPRLTLLARALCGEVIEIYPAEREGGYKNNNFFLPSAFGYFPSFELNLSFYLFRVLYLYKQQSLHINWNTPNDDTILSQQKALETSSLVLDKLFIEFPSASELYYTLRNQLIVLSKDSVPDDSWLYGKWMYAPLESKDLEELQHFNSQLKANNPAEITTTLKAQAVESIEQLTVDKKQQEDYVMTHNFEKVETAEEANGVWRDFDGKDDLQDHHNAVEELKMKFTVRVDSTVHSVYQAEFVENTAVAESAERDAEGLFLCYDEWDYKKRAYKLDFCKIYPRLQQKRDMDYYSITLKDHIGTLVSLRKMLASFNNKWVQQKKQNQGPEFDIDALTDLFTEVKMRKSPTENFYISSRKKDKDISILLLLDISLSSDGFAANRRVIDVEKQVSILFGEILNEFKVDFAIDGFNSKTRNYASYLTIKDFDESWQSAKGKIGAVEPNGYTRIGVALRHAGSRIFSRPAQNKWVILISDGKPNDFDLYEGKYGLEDVRQALRELNASNVHSYALAIEAQARYYLPLMFGQNKYQILTSPTELLKSLAHLYERIKSS
jgi:nitric oxide reductase NorD protein